MNHFSPLRWIKKSFFSSRPSVSVDKILKTPVEDTKFIWVREVVVYLQFIAYGFLFCRAFFFEPPNLKQSFQKLANIF